MLAKWIRRHLDEAGCERVSQAISQAESHTSAEIVPMIVSRSLHSAARTRIRAFILSLIFFYLLFIAVDMLVLIPADVLTNMPAPSFNLFFPLSFILSAILVCFDRFVLFLLPKDELAHNVSVRAEFEFHRSNIRQTSQHTGILLFVSLFERKAVVLADEKLASQLPPHTWDRVLKLLVEGLGQKDFAKGFCQAIEECGKIAAQYFPAAQHGNNELPNELIVKE